MRRSLYKEFMLAIASRIMRWLIQGIGRTCKIKMQIGDDVIQDLLKNRRPVIFAFWHNRIFYASYFLYRFFFKKGVHLTVLISQSDDGEIIARVVHLWGGTLARGSSTRGGKDALSIINKAIRKNNSSIAVTPDGPKGPKYVMQMGSIIAAQLTGAEIVPISFEAKKKWVLRSWDNFIIPKPFSPVVVSVEKPISVPRTSSESEREKVRQMVEKQMMQQLSDVESLMQQLQ